METVKGLLALVVASAITANVAAVEQIPGHRSKQIMEAAPVKPQVQPQRPRRVLIFNTPAHLMEKDPHKGYCIPYGSAALEAIGKKSGAFLPVISDELKEFLPQNLSKYDAIVLNNTSGPWITPTDENVGSPEFRQLGESKAAVESALRDSFLGYMRKGGGLVLLHFAIAGNAHWPEFKELCGGTFTGHPWNEEIGVIVEEPGNPLLSAFGGKAFRIADEIYEFGPPYDRGKVRVLLSIDPTRSNMGVRWINRKDDDFALTWVKGYGQGRLFCTSFGHRTELFWDARVLQFYLDAIQFAAGDLKAPLDPRADEPVRVGPGLDPVPGLPGFVSLFNGRDLTGWDGDTRIWSVQDGAITGQTTAERKVAENKFLLWKDQVENFELRLKFKLEGGNSGIYYRAQKRPANQNTGEALVGTQADFSEDGRWTGVIMEYTLREVLAERGEQVLISTNGERQVTGRLADSKQLLSAVKAGAWNEYSIVAKAGKVALAINGVPMCELDDRDPKRLVHGWLGVQVHTGPPMRVQFKDVFLRRL